jgi:malate synthase
MTKAIRISGPNGPRFEEIPTPEALAFVADLHRTFDARRLRLLEHRRARQAAFDRGEQLQFLPETAAIRDGEWTVAPVPEALRVRRVELTGPVDRKLVINGLNAAADVYMADFEDSTAPN